MQLLKFEVPDDWADKDCNIRKLKRKETRIFRPENGEDKPDTYKTESFLLLNCVVHSDGSSYFKDEEQLDEQDWDATQHLLNEVFSFNGMGENSLEEAKKK